MPALRVFVRDRDGTHRDESFHATDATFDVRRIVETYTGRWNIETAFQEARSDHYVRTIRGWSGSTILRAIS
jgi:hypothetical protein